jgi:hypothetical protein
MISADRAKEVLQPYHSDLAACVWEAWKKWKDEIEPMMGHVEARTRANFIHDFFTGAVRTRLGSHVEVRFEKVRQRHLMILEDEAILLRFKKLTPDMRTSNFATKTASDFDRQLPIPGIPPGARLTVGYVLDHFGTGLRGIFVALSIGNRPVWNYEITDGVAQVAPIQGQLPGLDEVTGGIPSSAPVSKLPKRRIRRKANYKEPSAPVSKTPKRRVRRKTNAKEPGEANKTNAKEPGEAK